MANFFETWDQMGTPRRVIEGALLPAAGGLGAGFAAVDSVPLFVGNLFIASAGAVLLGSQHLERPEAMFRGIVSGTIFGALVMVMLIALGPSEAPWWIVPPAPLPFLVLAGASVPLHLTGHRLRASRTVPTPA